MSTTPTTTTPTEPTGKTFWPYGLTIFIVLFIVGMVTLVVYLSTIRIDLVSDDYYKQELAYQQKIDSMKRAARDGHASLQLDTTGQVLMLSLPADYHGKPVTGKLHLYRPSDSRLDRTFDLKVDADGHQNVDIRGCQAGRWVAKLGWTCDGEQYYQETDLTMRGTQ